MNGYRTFGETINMPDYQWKLTIIERNLLLSNWIKLMPEAQAQILEEADELMKELPLSDQQRLLAFLETLKSNIVKENSKK
ncbi:hypothetical protein [Coleofasciculus sp. LEGE 07092]|uniref:hypothetical protein n=1 Tax=Coleofasciculus sp. LEGE 07092 TaxID=2777969 RepID=UPI00187E9C01|nr:hypothetical protein [Coleofasciculus sp. LEGE 07092]MBE9126412.1 hypothetical protein [Coleofasciculus sp. LEGE 07081]MBE9149809.1 hypothetical protein [Coleofasciculus sp. LEGE 07092]